MHLINKRKRGKIMRKLTKILSAILVVVLCVQIIAPGTVAIGANSYVGNNAAKSAADGTVLPSQSNALEIVDADSVVQNIEPTNNSSDDKIVTPIVGEIKELRTENAKHYRHKDGTYTAAIYPEPIHYMDSTGSWQDVDNTLTLNSKRKSASGKATYTPAASSLDIRIPQDFTDNQMLTIGKDGYTVGMRLKTSDNTVAMSKASATASGKVNSAKAVINNNFENIDSLSVSSIADDSVSNNFKVETANKEAMKLEKKVSAVNYNDILDGTDLQYVITPSKVKENIIVTETQDSYIYQFVLDLDGLIPIAQENGSIKLYENKDDDEALFTIETPYMYDANEETSFDVTMSLVGNILTVTANAEWINDESRKLPVIIDPTFSTNATTFYDATANKNTPIMNFDTYKFLYAGNGTLNVRRTYLKFTLPKLPEGSVVTESKLTLIQHDVKQGSSAMKLYVFDLTGLDSWSESSITWNNQPVPTEKNAAHDDISIKNLDYVSFETSNVDGHPYNFNITKAVKNWYEGRTNNGLMITNSDETADSQALFYSSDHDTASLHPSVTVIYNNNIGLEDYWTYETVDMGRSGTLYANPYNGSVTYAHSDLNMTGNLLPINISHIHNNNTDSIYSTVYSGMNVGKKYHLNIQEVVTYDSSVGMYKHYDGDGTAHYYEENGEVYTEEFNPTQTMTKNGSEYIISDAQDNKKYFNSAGQLYKLVDSNGNTQTFTFNGNLITKVTDPVGRVASLTYNSYGQLISITDPAGRVTNYTYSSTSTSANLTKITYPDGKTTSFTYSSYNITKVTAYDNSYCSLTYHYQTYRGYRVSTIGQRDKEAQVTNYSTFRYVEANESGIASGNTVVNRYFDTNKSKFDGSNTYLFDDYGRVTSVTNEDYQTHYAVYGSAKIPSSFNKITDSSELLTISTNALKNHGFESGNEYWSALQTATGSWGYVDDIDNSSLGKKYMQLELTSNTGTFEVGQDFTATAGQTYTVSVDINIPDSIELNGNNGVAFGLVYCVDGTWYNASSRWIGSTSGWERFSHTVTLPSGNISNCHVFLELVDAQGTVRFDNVQVEKSGGARSYNLVENSDFSKGTGSDVYKWTTSGADSVDGVQYIADAGRNFYMMIGSVSKAKYIRQQVYVNAKAGDTLILGGKVAAYATKAASGMNDSRKFEIRATLYDADGSYMKEVIIPFDPNVSQERQVKAAYVSLEEDCKYLYFYFRYYYQTDSFTIDDAFVYVDSYGEHYTYDENSGLTTTVYNDEGTKTTYDYGNDTDVDEVIQTVSGVEQTVATYSYDDNHNVTTTTNNIDTVVEYNYNNSGQVVNQTTMVTDNNEENAISESFEYYQNGNYVKKHINETGGITLYEYDNVDINDKDADKKIIKGLVTSVTDPNGNITTYTYNTDTDEMTSISSNANSNSTSAVNLTYENYLPKTITRNSTIYSYGYDAQNRVISNNIGNQPLVTNTYNEYQMLKKQTYGNGDYYMPIYNNKELLSGVSWNDNQISDYYYNENNLLSKMTDRITGINYQYDYAFYDLPFRITGSDGSLTTYDYSRTGNISRFVFSLNGDTIYSGKYAVNEQGLPEDVAIDSLNTLIHYNYDDFSRLTDYSYGPVVNSLVYQNEPLSSNIVIQYTNSDGVDNTYQNYIYQYDANGNIIETNETVSGNTITYDYDGLNRLTSESNGNETITYTYDIGGNLTSIIKDNSTLHTYTYGNSNWKDQLTAFDGKPIQYDEIGNPESYDGYTFVWQRGNQLARFHGNGIDITYVYDAQGHRIQQNINGLVIDYLYSGDLLMRQSDGTNTLDFAYDASKVLVGFKYNGTPYYYLRNQQSDIVAIVDMEGTVVAEYFYDAYGNITSYTGAMASINPFRYHGYYQDPETGWYYLGSRYYNPEWRRFLNADTLFVADSDIINSSNMYAYCNNNPIMLIDSNGTSAESIRYKIIKTLGDFTPNFIKELGEYHNEKSNERSQKRSEGVGTIIGNVLEPVSQFAEEETSKIPLLVLWEPMTDVPDALDPEKDNRLRNLFPKKAMYFGAGIGAWLLDFHLNVNIFDPNFGNYTTIPGSTQWQSRVGYAWYYDLGFAIGGPTQVRRFPFVSNGIHYIIWCWKADYWNLGAGAEIGIYYTDDATKASRGYYSIDVGDSSAPYHNGLKVTVEMDVIYDGVPITENFVQTNWWVTSFSPRIQSPDIEKLEVNLKVKFADHNRYVYSGLMESFYKYVENGEGAHYKSEGLSWTETTPKSRPSGHTGIGHYCGKHPVMCTCSCTTTGCGKPCKEYSDFGDTNKYSIIGNSGFEFNINF